MGLYTREVYPPLCCEKHHSPGRSPYSITTCAYRPHIVSKVAQYNFPVLCACMMPFVSASIGAAINITSARPSDEPEASCSPVCNIGCEFLVAAPICSSQRSPSAETTSGEVVFKALVSIFMLQRSWSRYCRALTLSGLYT